MRSKLKLVLINLFLTFVFFAVVFVFMPAEHAPVFPINQNTKRIFFKASDVGQPPKSFFKPLNKKLFQYSFADQDGSQKHPPGYFSSYFREAGKYRSISKIKETGDLVYDVTYELNQHGIRKVEGEEKKSSAKKFVAAYGCSSTFGEGLPQGEDYPSQLNKMLSKDWKVYNFGYHGYGPNSVISNILNKNPYEKIISEPEGVFVWYFISSHLERFFCTLECYSPNSSWILSLPEVKQTSSGYSLVSSRFADSPFLWRKVFLEASKFFDFSRLGAYRYTKSHFIQFVDALDFIANSTSNKLLKKIFVFHSSYELKGLDVNFFVQRLHEKGFVVIDMNAHHKNVPREHLSLPADGHNSQLKNWYVSKVLSNYLSSDKQP